VLKHGHKQISDRV